MTRLWLHGLLLCSLPLLSGCAALNSFEDALEEAGWAQFDRSDRRSNKVGRVSLLAYRADGSWTVGAGAVIEGGRVLTVAHVLEGATEIEVEISGRLIAVDAHVTRRIPSAPEDLIELRLEESEGLFGFGGFEPDEVLEVAHGEPTQLWASSGLFNLPCASLPGDSGSPMLDAQGRLVGLLVGRLGGNPVWATLPPTQKPSPRVPFDEALVTLVPDCSDPVVGSSSEDRGARAHQEARRTEGLRRV
ncbi:MAG: trypsin-like peptidase domain-containing protein [Planctomycetes bacterium]|nr:trypsin-like peptidase domain-containing protein [Planctomycetota bacterium]